MGGEIEVSDFRDLPEGKNSGSRRTGPIEANNRASDKIAFTILKRLKQRMTANFRYQRFASKKDDAWAGFPRISEYLREIEIVGEHYVASLPGECANLAIGRRWRARRSPMERVMASVY